jgi:hypothetical protein
MFQIGVISAGVSVPVQIGSGQDQNYHWPRLQ